MAVLVSCVGCDQATKSIAVAHLPAMKTFSYLGDAVRLQLTYNRGAFLGLGASLPDDLRYSLFTVGTCLLLTGVFVVALFAKSGTFATVLAASLFLAGGIGNLMDRVLHGGLVVDFLNVGLGPLRSGIFNMADVAIMGGSILLLFYALHRPKDNG